MLRKPLADAIAPTLSNASDGTPTADGADDPSVDTNEGNGTLYWAVLTNGGSCTDAQLKAGSGGNIVAGKAGNQAVSGTGTQITSDITGLSPSTDYEIVFLHRDAAGNDSSQATVGLTTTAGGSVAPSLVGTPSQVDAHDGNGSTSVTVPAGTNVCAVAFWSGWAGATVPALTAITIGGQSFTVRASLAQDELVSGGAAVSVWTVVLSGSGSQTLAWTFSPNEAVNEGGELVVVYYENCNTADIFRAAAVDHDVDTNAITAALASTATSDRVVGFTTGTTPNITGVTEFIDDAALNSHVYDVGDATGLSGTVNVENSSRFYSAVAAISLKAS